MRWASIRAGLGSLSLSGEYSIVAVFGGNFILGGKGAGNFVTFTGMGIAIGAMQGDSIRARGRVEAPFGGGHGFSQVRY